MRSIITITVPSEAQAYDALHALKQLHADDTITVHDTAVVERRRDGELSLKMSRGGEKAIRRTVIGAVIGGLAGLLAGPAGVALGGAVGIFAGGMSEATHGLAINDYVDRVGKRLNAGAFAVIAEVHERSTAPVDAQVAALGGEVVRETRQDVGAELVEKRAEERRAQIEADRATRESEQTERMTAFVEADLTDARAQLRSAAEIARERLDEAKLELADKIAALDAQIAKAPPEARALLEQRMAEIKADLGERERKLSHALEIASAALH